MVMHICIFWCFSFQESLKSLDYIIRVFFMKSLKKCIPVHIRIKKIKKDRDIDKYQ